jgi:hypothetical protein
LSGTGAVVFAPLAWQRLMCPVLLRGSITELVRHTLAATAPLINKLHRPRCFELMGYDFMVDDAMNVRLVPCPLLPYGGGC